MSGLKKRIATLTILVVSASAFVAGYVQNEVVDDANEKYEASNKHQISAIRIEQEAKRLYDFDLIQFQRADDAYNEAWRDAQQIDILQADLTSTELYARQYDIYVKIFDAYTLFFDSNAWWITNSFLDNPDDILQLATEPGDGYSYIILPEEYGNTSPVDIYTIDEFLGVDGLDFPEDIITFIKNIDPTLTLFGEINFLNLNTLLFNQLWWEQDQVVKNRQIGNELTLQANSLTRSVSITTVAVILATSMSNRLNEKEQEANFDTIIENVSEYQSDRKIKDKLSVPVLSTAIILSIAGLLLAL